MNMTFGSFGKRVLALIVSCVLAVGCLPVGVFADEYELNVAKSTTEASVVGAVEAEKVAVGDADLANLKVGDEIDVIYKLNGVTGINNYTFYVDFNPAVLEAVGPQTVADADAVTYTLDGVGTMKLVPEDLITQQMADVPKTGDTEYDNALGGKADGVKTAAQLGRIKLAGVAGLSNSSTATTNTDGKLFVIRFKVLAGGSTNVALSPVGGAGNKTEIFYAKPQSETDAEVVQIGSLLPTVEIVIPSTGAVSDFTFDSSTGTVTGYTGGGGAVVIPASIGGVKVTAIGEKAFYENKTITSVVIPNGVTSIGNQAFENCINMVDIKFPESILTIGVQAFGNCDGLTSVAIPNGVTSIGNAAFQVCDNLETVDLPNTLKNIGTTAFGVCPKISTVIIRSNPDSIGSNIVWCAKNVTIYCIKGSKADDISLYSDSYTNCSIEYIADESDFTFDSSTGTIAGYTGSGGDVVIPASIGGVKVTTIGKMAVHGNMTITSVVIPNGVTSIGAYAFRNCEKITSITIPNSVTEIGGFAFSYCSDLTGITIPNSVTSIQQYAFRNCGKIKSVTIPSSVTSMGEAPFTDCEKLTEIKVNEANTNYKDINGVLFDKKGETLIQYPQGKNGSSYEIPNSVESIGHSAFSYCSGLTSITIPNSVESIGHSAFSYCSGLTSITIPNSVESIGHSAFEHCRGLTSITIPSSITSLKEGVFNNCIGLTSITIPNSVTSIESYVFANCIGLKSITIPSSVTSIYYDSDLGSDWGILAYVKNATIHCVKGSKADNASLYPSSCTIEYIVKYFTVKYDANGGSGAPSLQTKTEGKDLTLSSDVPKRSGYKFVGWAESNLATSPKYQAGGKYTTDSDVTLYAVWSKILDTAKPVITVSNISGGKKVSIQCGTANAKIYYTTNGSNPSKTSKLYSGAIEFKDVGSTTIKAIAVCDGYNDSEVAENTVTVAKVSKPKASNEGGTIKEKTEVSLSSDTEDAVIYYTIDGKTPTVGSSKYTSKIVVEESLTIKAIAVCDGYANSEVSEFSYTYSKSKKYTIGRDNWSFPNIATSFGYKQYPEKYYIDYPVYVKVLGETMANGIFEGKKWKGSCNGLSLTSALFFEEALNFKDYAPKNESVENLYSVQMPNNYGPDTKKGLNELIECYQVIQYNEIIQKKINSIGEVDGHIIDRYKYDTENYLNEIIEAVQKFESTGEDAIVLYIKNSNEKIAHVVLPYKVEKTEKDVYRIYVYDSNLPKVEDDSKNKFITIDKNNIDIEDKTPIYFESGGDKFCDVIAYYYAKDAFYAMNFKEDVKEVSLQSGDSEREDKRALLNVNSENVVIKNSDGVLIDDIEEAFKFIDIDGDYEGYTKYWVPLGDYTIENKDNSLDYLEVSMGNSRDSYKITTSDTDATVSAGIEAETYRIYMRVDTKSLSEKSVKILSADGSYKTIESTGRLLGIATSSEKESCYKITADSKISLNGIELSCGTADKVGNKDISKDIIEGSSGSENSDDYMIYWAKNTLKQDKSSIKGKLAFYVDNNTDSVRTGAFFAGLYSKDGKLIEILYNNEYERLGIGENYINVGNVNYGGLSEEGYVIKCFLWDSFHNMIPLANSLVEKIK